MVKGFHKIEILQSWIPGEHKENSHRHNHIPCVPISKQPFKGTLHLRNNIGLKDSLDPPEQRVYNKN